MEIIELSFSFFLVTKWRERDNIQFKIVVLILKFLFLV